jgi:hypothetical protein
LAEPFWFLTSGVAPVDIRPAGRGERQRALLAFDLPVFEPGLDGDRFGCAAGVACAAASADLDRQVHLAQPYKRHLERAMDHVSDFRSCHREGGGGAFDVVACRGVINLHRS